MGAQDTENQAGEESCGVGEGYELLLRGRRGAGGRGNEMRRGTGEEEKG